MRQSSCRPRASPAGIAALAVAVAALAACASPASREEEEAARNTIVCKLAGERLVVRFDSGEARLLMSSGDRVTLYQIPSASGTRYSNGTMELLARGTDLQMARNGAPLPVSDCQPYTAPK